MPRTVATYFGIWYTSVVSRFGIRLILAIAITASGTATHLEPNNKRDAEFDGL